MYNKIYDRSRRIIARSILSAAALGLTANPVPAQNIGTNTTVEPYLLPSMVDVKTVSILTVKDLASGNGYKMVGIPDGLGAFRNIELEKGRKDGSEGNKGKSDAAHQFTLLMNHELGSIVGTVREHGSKGAFVSQWTIDRRTLEVINGQDLTDSPVKVYNWNVATSSYVPGTTAWQRFCSADLPAVSALGYRKGKTVVGTSDRIFLNGKRTMQAGRLRMSLAVPIRANPGNWPIGARAPSKMFCRARSVACEVCRPDYRSVPQR